MRRGVLLALLAVLAASLTAQSAPPAQTPPTGVNPGPAAAPLPSAEPYEAGEFDPLLLKVRRAEILTVGAFPLAFLLAGLGYDYAYYLGSGFPRANIPWPLGPGTSAWTPGSQPARLQAKNLTLVSVSLAAGVLLAAADWVLGP